MRPKGSYKTLINKRTYFLKIVGDKNFKIKTEFLKHRPCPGFQANDYKYMFEKDSLEIARCNKCEMFYVNPILKSSALEKIYKHEDYSAITKKLQGESHHYKKHRFGKERVGILKKMQDGLRRHSKMMKSPFIELMLKTLDR